MTQILGAFRRDANGVPIWTNGIIATKTRTYDGVVGVQGAVTLFTVTGDVLVNVFAVCSADLTSGGAATLEVGISGNTAALIPQTTATNIDNGEIWLDTSPATVETVVSAKILTAGTDILETIATADLSGGVLKFYCAWTPLSDDGNVVAA